MSILADRDIGFLAAGGVLRVLGATSALGVIAAGVLVDRMRTRITLIVLSTLVLNATLARLIPAEATAALTPAVSRSATPGSYQLGLIILSAVGATALAIAVLPEVENDGALS